MRTRIPRCLLIAFAFCSYFHELILEILSSHLGVIQELSSVVLASGARVREAFSHGVPATSDRLAEGVCPNTSGLLSTSVLVSGSTNFPHNMALFDDCTQSRRLTFIDKFHRRMSSSGAFSPLISRSHCRLSLYLACWSSKIQQRCYSGKPSFALPALLQISL